MSNTRRTSDAGKFRPERFASSAEYDRGLMANIVAKRCSVLDEPVDRELIWFLQSLSHQQGGIRKFAADLIAQFPQRLATATMQKIGFKHGQIYSANQVKAVREDMVGNGAAAPAFLLKGEFSIDISADELLEINLRRSREVKAYPSTYPAADFMAACAAAARDNLEKYLLVLCVDPAVPVKDGSLWYFPTLVSTLREFMAMQVESHCQKMAVTSLGQKIHDALDYTNEVRCLSLIEGNSRFGKTHSVMDWCQRHPGRARYIQLESTHDEISFYRAIAKVLGVSINLNSKAQELRLRIEETVQGGDLTLVFDEAHYLWPNIIDSRSLPARINWILTSLVNKGVPVALVTTPQFLRNQQALETRTRWTSEQFTGRLGHYEKLPDKLNRADLEKVAIVLTGGAKAAVIEMLADYAETSAKYLAGIYHVVKRALFVIGKEGRAELQLADVARVIAQSVIPSDEAFASAMQATEKPSRRRAFGHAAIPLQPAFSGAERQLQPSSLMHSRSKPEHDAELVH